MITDDKFKPVQSNQKYGAIKQLQHFRMLLVSAASIYLVWWLAVDLLFPNAFNPLGSRLAVVASVAAFCGLSFVNDFFKRHIRYTYLISVWLITFHYYYLFLNNGDDINWIIGAFVTVIATNLSMPSNLALICYAVFVMLLSGGLVVLIPSLAKSVFLPGLLTLMIQAIAGLSTRLSLIKNLKESNERFQMLFNSTFEGIVVHDGGQILEINRAFSNMVGYSENELIGKDIFFLTHPEEKQNGCEKILTSDTNVYESRCLTKSGEVLDIELRAKEFVYRNQKVRMVTVQDIRDRKRAEQEKIRALTMAENVRVRDDFITIASHELKTPLSTMQIQLYLIKQHMNAATGAIDITELMKGPLRLFERQILRLQELVETMLDVSRISTGRFHLNKTDFDLAEIVHRLATSLSEQGDSKKPKPQIAVEAPEIVMIQGDLHRLEQVVENILTNAQKYGDDKAISAKLRKDSGQAIFSVEDNGIGISEEALPRIFNRFERAVSARNISGFGLGLYIVKQIVDAHGGQITVKSQLGQGSTFTVVLPLRLPVVAESSHFEKVTPN